MVSSKKHLNFSTACSGKENTVADSESRTFLDSTDWQLDPTVITPFLTNWNTDLFASRLTVQLPQDVKAYQSAWSRWSRWCAKGKINPISAPVSKILEFLANAFSDGLDYRSINVLRSAISSTHSRIDDFLVGQHPRVTKLIKGVLNSRPPKPQYSYTWDVKKVTAHLASLGSNSSLSLKQLSRKLVLLFALACPERTASLAKLDLRYCRVIPEGVVFSLTSPRKRGNPNKLAQASPLQQKIMPCRDLPFPLVLLDAGSALPFKMLVSIRTFSRPTLFAQLQLLRQPMAVFLWMRL